MRRRKILVESFWMAEHVGIVVAGLNYVISCFDWSMKKVRECVWRVSRLGSITVN